MRHRGRSHRSRRTTSRRGRRYTCTTGPVAAGSPRAVDTGHIGSRRDGADPITSKSYPFTAEGTDLAAYAYTLEEYFVRGKANVYDWGSDGEATKPRIQTSNAPYATRIVVRRPVKHSKFGGNVWVELNNPSRRWDVEVQWPTVQEKVMRDGDIWVAVTVKPISIAALKRFDAERYGSLSMANPLPPSEQTCGLLPGQTGYDENTSKLYGNGLAWDIISQVGALSRGEGKNIPLRGYKVKTAFATGESQTAQYLNVYAYNFGSDAKRANGDYVYDGCEGAARPRVAPTALLADRAPRLSRARARCRTGPHAGLGSRAEPWTLLGDDHVPVEPGRTVLGLLVGHRTVPRTRSRPGCEP
ncbi:MAG: alpha/beta hydrolase domain-containing protein [Haloechinothrix sp.]